jgi:pilus assembly protein CpaF
MFTAAQGAKLAQLMAEQQNFLIAGPAGAGKTTLLRALLAQDPERRTVVVEDTAELLPMPGHVVGLQARQANIDGRGAITLDALAQQALRMQPQRLVIGEVRGSEVMVLLQSMNTGHAGSAATIHANSPQTVYPRLRGLAQSAGASDSAFQLLAQSAIQKVIFLGGPQGELGGSGLGNRVQRRVQWIGSLQW